MFPNPASPSSFYMCANGYAYLQQCPSTLVWSNDDQRCDYEENVVTTTTVECLSYEVSYNGHCYYLDGSGGRCAPYYSRASTDILSIIASKFIGKNYKSIISDNCCVWTSDTYQTFGMNADCNTMGPFKEGPLSPGGGCRNATNRHPKQLTFCGRD
ncbi:unnamed protein product [Didymodactylos carnosus]|uniref:Chitin-binding type-2 domain-containing protein n=1 Tax=Didymodactylos carnosus TaxID=1234261 RepID=A0A815CRP4_9BILA|nr:unnamed protein product [Didymodactylos carnosus]CAF4089483.1 unnamed protein product [Didymodactylos carnosus]